MKKILDNGSTDSDKLYYMYTDHTSASSGQVLGNVGALSDKNGNYVSGSLTLFRPFGDFRRTPSTNPDITDRGYTGHSHNNAGDNDLGLIYMRARYFLPNTNRFLSPDPIVPNPKNPQSLNRYSYVNNNPINFSDPTGHCAETGDDGCWGYHDRIIQLCPECRYFATTPGTTLDQYGYNYQKELFDRVNGGWRPDTSYPNFMVDYDTLAGALGAMELGADTYNQLYKLLGATNDFVPGPVGLGMVLIQAGLENRDESMERIGYEMVAAGIADAAVDGVAGAGAVAAYSAFTGPGAIVAGVGAFVFIEVGGNYVSEAMIDVGWEALTTDQNRAPVIVPYNPQHPRVRTPPAIAPVGTPLPPGWTQ